MDQEYKRKSLEAEEYVRNHPAIQLASDVMGGPIVIERNACCKHGHYDYLGPKTVRVWKNDEDYEKWRNSTHFDPDDEDPLFPDFSYVDVPYKEYHGEPWAFHKVVFSVELTWFLCSSDEYSILSPPDKIQGFRGTEFECDTYEELWMEMSEWIKENLGDYPDDYFITDEEKENNSNESPMNFDNNTVEFNGDWITITSDMINHRWFRKFSETEYFKENWKDTFDDCMKDLFDIIMKNTEDPNSMRVKRN